MATFAVGDKVQRRTDDPAVGTVTGVSGATVRVAWPCARFGGTHLIHSTVRAAALCTAGEQPTITRRTAGLAPDGWRLNPRAAEIERAAYTAAFADEKDGSRDAFTRARECLSEREQTLFTLAYEAVLARPKIHGAATGHMGAGANAMRAYLTGAR